MDALFIILFKTSKDRECLLRPGLQNELPCFYCFISVGILIFDMNYTLSKPPTILLIDISVKLEIGLLTRDDFAQNDDPGDGDIID